VRSGCATTDDELMPRDPDLDDLAKELRLHRGPLFIDGVEVTRENLAAAFADARRLPDDDI
jgi:hypothetical protein